MRRSLRPRHAWQPYSCKECPGALDDEEKLCTRSRDLRGACGQYCGLRADGSGRERRPDGSRPGAANERRSAAAAHDKAVKLKRRTAATDQAHPGERSEADAGCPSSQSCPAVKSTTSQGSRQSRSAITWLPCLTDRKSTRLNSS